MTETAVRERAPHKPLPEPPARRPAKPLPPTPDQASRLAQQPAQDTGLDQAPQVGVTVKKSSRFSLPFKNPFAKSEDTKAREAAAKAEKEKILQARAKAKKEDVQAQLQAKRLNEANAQETAKVKAGFKNVTNKVDKPEELTDLTKAFELWLGREHEARARARATVLGSGEHTPELEAEAELAAERAAELEWNLAPTRVRAFRPLRFDEFDKALNEVRQMLHESRSAEIGEVGALLMQNELTDGTAMTPQQAMAQVRGQAELERRQVRAAQSKGLDPEKVQADDRAASDKRTEAFLKQRGGDTRQVGASEQAWTKAETTQLDLNDKYGHLDKVLLGKSAATGGQFAAKGLGQGIKMGTKGLTKIGVDESPDTAIAGIVGGSIDGLSGAFKFLGQVLGFVDQVSDIRKGVADKNAAVGATRTAVQSLLTLAAMAKTSLKVAKTGMEGLGQTAGALGTIGLPVVSLVTNALTIVDGVLELVPVSIRLGTGLSSVDEALLEEKFPLAAAYTRINSRNAQLVEKASWKIGKSATQLGLSIGELATGGGMGGITGAKMAVSIVDVAHTLGHKVYDTVSESKASDARKGFFVKHEEGASRLVLKHDIAASVDLMILAARKGASYAVETLLDYGATKTEIASMPPHLLREKILSGLDASGDPKTVKEKFDAAKKTVMDTLGMDTAIRKDERTTMEKVSDAGASAVKFVAKLPFLIGEQIDKIDAKHEDAKKLIAAKNERGHKGRSDRGRGAVLEHMLRGGLGIEKSFAKVRQDMAQDGLDTSDMRTTADKKDREKKVKERAEQARKADATYRLDPGFVAKVSKATLPELYEIWNTMDKNDPEQVGNLQFFKHEVDRRLVEAGSKPTR